jgi:glycine/D-amino acid oxidase-like deaminating enzyme
MTELPTEAKAVIIGGGVVGCSVAYHLVKLGWRDVVVLERKRLTSGTTWHAAGPIGQLRATVNLTKLAQYSAELYSGLEAETGIGRFPIAYILPPHVGMDASDPCIWSTPGLEPASLHCLPI